MALAGHHLHGVGQRRHDALPVLGGRLGGAGQVDDERVPALGADGAREHGEGRDGDAVGAHGLGDAGHLAVGHVAGSLAQREARAAAGEHDIGIGVVAGVDECAGDKRALVHFHNAADALPTLLGNELLQFLPRLVGFQSAGVGTRDDSEFDGHFYFLS